MEAFHVGYHEPCHEHLVYVEEGLMRVSTQADSAVTWVDGVVGKL